MASTRDACKGGRNETKLGKRSGSRKINKKYKKDAGGRISVVQSKSARQGIIGTVCQLSNILQSP